MWLAGGGTRETDRVVTAHSPKPMPSSLGVSLSSHGLFKMAGQSQQVLLQCRQVLLCRHQGTAVRVPPHRRLVLYPVVMARGTVFRLDALQLLIWA